MQMEVRCCCQPQKLLGWLPVPDDVHDGRVLRFIVRPARWEFTSVEATPEYKKVDEIELPVARLGIVGVTILALKSEETPIERLRLIPGFVEATRA